MIPNKETYKNCWQNCLSSLRSQVAAEEYVKWLDPLKVYDFDGTTLVISVPNNSHAAYIDTHFIPVLRPIIDKEFEGKVRSLKYYISEKIAQPSADEDKKLKNFVSKNSSNEIQNPFIIPGIKKTVIDPQLNFDLTFENFVEGDCNRLARAAGLSVSENPGKSVFNPMFVYGDSGLGKTHVAQAIGIEVKKRFPDKNVLYVSTQRFIDQFTTASRKQEINEFVRFYQMMDVLIVDDIQELTGKPQTQIVFFNIFNFLHQNNKQLVFTSDKSPVELKDIENRLISRFKWGLSVQLYAPDFETKVAIIKSKSKRYNVELSDEVIEYLAENIHTNIRELEGAVSSFAAHSALLKVPASIDLAKKILKSYVSKKQKEITIEYIQEVICDFYKVKKEEFLSSKRTREIAQARQVAMYMCKEYTNMSLKCIGAAIGGKSHATVVHACKTVVNLLETDKEFSKQIHQIKNRFK